MNQSAGRSAEDGFVLMATLWFVALLALVSIVIEGWVAAALDRGALLGERVTAQAGLLGAEQRVAFLLAVGSASPRGLELGPPTGTANPDESAAPGSERRRDGPFVALDERPYRAGDVVVRLQDAGGLYDLNSADRETLGKLLKSYGLGGSDAESLATTLFEYAGKPADIRAGNVDDADYRNAGLPMPRHAPLLTPWEPLRILGWEGRDALWRRPLPFFDIATLGPVGGININTAPPRILTAVAGLDERAAARVAAMRRVAAIEDRRGLDIDAAGFDREDRALGFTPSGIVRVKLDVPGEPVMHVMQLRLTPTGKSPVRIDYAVDLPSDMATGAGVATPLPEALAPGAAASD